MPEVHPVLRAWTDPVFMAQFLGVVLLGGIFALELIRRRFWCRYVCPLGAFYGLAARAGVIGRTVSSACIECGRCAEACPMSCISTDGHKTLSGECILCLNCQAA
ncbi:unnamed protein product, partial [marine sediment metagenome]